MNFAVKILKAKLIYLKATLQRLIFTESVFTVFVSFVFNLFKTLKKKGQCICIL